MGRPRLFDEEDVLNRAMELFWSRGYGTTSVADITDGLGLHPGSLYRAFGGKRALFLRAIAHYRDSQARTLAPMLLAGGPVIPRIRALLVHWIDTAIQQEYPRGCLIANTAGELSSDREMAADIAEVLAIIEDGFLQGLQVAAQQGEIPATSDLPACASMLTMLLEGLQILVKVDRDPRRLTSAVDVALASLLRTSSIGITATA